MHNQACRPVLPSNMDLTVSQKMLLMPVASSNRKSMSDWWRPWKLSPVDAVKPLA